MKLATSFSGFVLLVVSLAAPFDSRQEEAAYTSEATSESTTSSRPRALERDVHISTAMSSPLPTAMNMTPTSTTPYTCVTTIPKYFRGWEPFYLGSGTCRTYATTTTETRYLKCDGLCSVREGRWRFRDHGPVVHCHEWVTVPTKTISTTLCTTAPITGDITMAILPSFPSFPFAAVATAAVTATAN